MADRTAQLERLLVAIYQLDAGRQHALERELQQVAAATAHRDPLLHLRREHIGRQVHGVDLVLAAVVAAAVRHQQMAVAVGTADLLVFVTHGHIGIAAGADHHKGIVDTVGGKHPGVHPHQRAAGIGPAGHFAAAAVHAGLQLHRPQAPGGVGLAVGIAITCGGVAKVVANTAAHRYRTAVVDPLQVLAFLAAFHAHGKGTAEVDRDHPLCLHRPLAVADLTVGRQVDTAVAPQRFAPAQVDQPGARAVTGAHIEVARAEAAEAVEVQAQGDLLATLAQLHVRAVDPAQVGVMTMALQALIAETEALAVVLIAEGNLVALFTVELALRHGSVQYTESAQAHIRTQTPKQQRFCGFDMAFEGEEIADAMTQAGRGDAGPVAEVAHCIVSAQAAGGHREIRKAFLQQAAGDVERQRGGHLAPKCIGGNHHGLAGTVDERHVGQGVGAWLQLGGAGLVAVDEQIQ